MVEGILQNQDNVISVKAERVLPLSVTKAATSSHDFTEIVYTPFLDNHPLEKSYLFDLPSIYFLELCSDKSSALAL